MTRRMYLGACGALLVLLFGAAVPCLAQPAPATDRVAAIIDTSEAEAALAILSKAQAKQPIAEADWQKLFASEPYVALKRREAFMGRAFEDSTFKDYILAPETVAKAADFSRTLDDWKRTDVRAAAAQALAFLPAKAAIRVTIYPLIKPRINSFVFEDDKIMLYMDPAIAGSVFRNTLTHELHHIGHSAVQRDWDGLFNALAPDARRTAMNTGRFAEGIAMVAAAGSADVHPHAASAPKDRERWDRDSANFDADLAKLDTFLQDVLDGKFPDARAVQAKAMEFYGEQGPWYTVGYRMAAAVERTYGRAALLACTEDPRRLLATWNVIASSQRPAAAKWSAKLLEGIGAVPAEPSRASR